MPKSLEKQMSACSEAFSATETPPSEPHPCMDIAKMLCASGGKCCSYDWRRMMSSADVRSFKNCILHRR